VDYWRVTQRRQTFARQRAAAGGKFCPADGGKRYPEDRRAKGAARNSPTAAVRVSQAAPAVAGMNFIATPFMQ